MSWDDKEEAREQDRREAARQETKDALRPILSLLQAGKADEAQALLELILED